VIDEAMSLEYGDDAWRPDSVTNYFSQGEYGNHLAVFSLQSDIWTQVICPSKRGKKWSMKYELSLIILIQT